MDQEGILPEQFKEYKERMVFDLFDVNGDGHISAVELGKVLRALGQNPTDKEVQDVLNKFDKDGDHVIEYDEYVEMLKYNLKDPQIFEIELREAFRRFDRDRNDDLNFVELRRALTSLGEPLTDCEAIQLCKMMDTDGDKRVTIDEAVRFMLRGYDDLNDEQQCNAGGNTLHFQQSQGQQSLVQRPQGQQPQVQRQQGQQSQVQRPQGQQSQVEHSQVQQRLT